MWRVHRLDQICGEKPANPLTYKSVRLWISGFTDWPVFLYISTTCANLGKNLLAIFALGISRYIVGSNPTEAALVKRFGLSEGSILPA